MDEILPHLTLRSTSLFSFYPESSEFYSMHTSLVSVGTGHLASTTSFGLLSNIISIRMSVTLIIASWSAGSVGVHPEGSTCYLAQKASQYLTRQEH